jgi:hypothetical protein
MSFTERTRCRVSPFRATAVALAVAGAIAIAGCGGGSSTQSPSSSTASPAPAAATAATGAGAGSCGEATAALVKKHLARPDVVSVTTEGGCHDATIVTSLGPSDSVKGLAICDSAAEVAYAGDISSITVLAANNKELAIGIKDQPCIGEP